MINISTCGIFIFLFKFPSLLSKQAQETLQIKIIESRWPMSYVGWEFFLLEWLNQIKLYAEKVLFRRYSRAIYGCYFVEKHLRMSLGLLY